MPSDDDELVDAPGLAAWLGVPVGTVYQWNHAGTGPPRLKLGKLVRYRRSDVKRWLQGRAVDHGAN